MSLSKRAWMVVAATVAVGCSSAQVSTNTENARSSDRAAGESVPLANATAPSGAQIAIQPVVRAPSHASLDRLTDGLNLLAAQLDANTRFKSAFPAVLASTFVNLDRIDDTSPLGRVLTEGLVARLQVRGWNLYDVRLSKAVAVTPEGEFVLSRDPKRLEYQYATAAVLAGTYTIAASEVLVHARIIDVASGVVVASAEVRIPIDEEIARLLTDQDQLRPMRIIRGQ